MLQLDHILHDFRGNLFGGVTAAIVALPLALAFGISSGLGPAAGLYGAAILGLFAAVFGGTATQISGPTGPMTVVMAATITELVSQYPEQGLALAFTTVFLGGGLQILFGYLKLGKYIAMVPYPVISGFMSGIGVIIILLQLAPILGFSAQSNIISAVQVLPSQVLGLNTAAVSTGMLTLATFYLWRGRLNQILPAPVIALVVGTIALSVLFPSNSIDKIGSISAGLPEFRMPLISFDAIPVMFTSALMLAVLGSIDSLLTSLVADNITGTQHRSDRELIGQGIGNAIVGLFGGLPGAGATMRTMVNIKAGGTGPMSGVIHAVILLAIITGLGFLFEDIPLAALAGILIKVGLDIVDWPFVKRLFRLPRFPVALMLLVFFITVFVDLISAVFIGVFIKNLVTIEKLSGIELGNVIFSNGETDCEQLTDAERLLLTKHNGEAVLLRITGPLSYAVGRGLALRLKQFADEKLLIVDLSQATIIGISTAMEIEGLIRRALHQGATVKLIAADNNHELQHVGVIDLVGLDNVLTSIDDVV